MCSARSSLPFFFFYVCVIPANRNMGENVKRKKKPLVWISSSARQRGVKCLMFGSKHLGGLNLNWKLKRKKASVFKKVVGYFSFFFLFFSHYYFSVEKFSIRFGWCKRGGSVLVSMEEEEWVEWSLKADNKPIKPKSISNASFDLMKCLDLQCLMIIYIRNVFMEKWRQRPYETCFRSISNCLLFFWRNSIEMQNLKDSVFRKNTKSKKLLIVSLTYTKVFYKINVCPNKFCFFISTNHSPFLRYKKLCFSIRTVLYRSKRAKNPSIKLNNRQNLP